MSKKEMEKLERDFEKFDFEVKKMSMDKVNEAPQLDVEPQTKIAQKDLDKFEEVRLKPLRSIVSKEKFNEKFRDKYDYEKTYVNFIAENKEIVGESIKLWTKPFPGMPAEEWEVPVNKPVSGPRYLANQICLCKYHKLVMEDKMVEETATGSFYGKMVAKHTVNRLDAMPVSERRSVFMTGKF